MILKFIFLLSISFCSLAQTKFQAIIKEDELLKESMSRTVFIRAYMDGDKSADNAIRATGIILKDGFLLTNEHVMRPFREGKRVEFQIFTQGKRFHKFNDVYLIECNNENDLCLLRTKNNYRDSYFTLEPPSFRTISNKAPLGLFKDEALYFNGFCSGWPKMQKTKYVDYVLNGYVNSTHPYRKKDTPSLQFSDLNGKSIACGGDSGGPIFDQNLYLYGIVRDFQNSTNDPSLARNYAVPMNIITNFINENKSKPSTIKIPTIE